MGGEGYREVKVAADELQLAFDFYREEAVTEEEVDKAYSHVMELLETIEMKNMLSNEEDQLEPLLGKSLPERVEPKPRTGRICFFRMYQRYQERQGYKTEVTNYQPCDEAGIKTVTLRPKAKWLTDIPKAKTAYTGFVRVSPFNAQGKRMTSFASVFVTPLRTIPSTSEVNTANLTWGYFPFRRCRRTERK